MAYILSMMETSEETGFVEVQENINRTEVDQLIKNIENLIARYYLSKNNISRTTNHFYL